ncbi:MAG TPA: CYCXC family (seleno)protein [Terriglobales bacterium]|nr:CYCXC family (seleno)protein [Terriglobales bacterium]
MKKLFGVLFVLALGLTMFAQSDSNPVPAYHKAPPSKTETLPAILPAGERIGPAFQHDYQDHAYELAAKIPKVIYQLPCYCYCDRSVGHKSLHSCYESSHAAHCAACLKELYFAYTETKKGKTPAQIRAAIMKGDWEQIDLASAAAIK